MSKGYLAALLLVSSVTVASETLEYDVQFYHGSTVATKAVTLDPEHLALEFTDVNPNSGTYNETVSLDTLLHNGKYTLVNFWEPWCQNCMLEMPELERLYQGGVDVVGLSETYLLPKMKPNHDRVQKYLVDISFPYSGVPKDAADSQELRFGIIGEDLYPVSLVFDTSGSLTRVYEGEIGKEQVTDLLFLVEK
jgi:thiol-disulfide isomerase/thioredoxin